MSKWTDKPDWDGYYWLRLGENDRMPTLARIEEGHVYEMGCNKVDSQSVEWYSKGINGTRWQWQKVKPCES